ncbi:MAG: hypothetical protein EOO28_03895 [Comamonadaceae bacterium]|nr:MAG: hypothetical protein EOO28_03895 [Comamonadaceae bacterium]
MSFARTPFSALLGLTGGWMIWSSCFVALYALMSIGCEQGWHHRPILGWHTLGFTLVATWLAHLVAQAALLTRMLRVCWRSEGIDWIAPLSALLCGLSLFATFWTGWPVLALPACI